MTPSAPSMMPGIRGSRPFTEKRKSCRWTVLWDVSVPFRIFWSAAGRELQTSSGGSLKTGTEVPSGIFIYRAASKPAVITMGKKTGKSPSLPQRMPFSVSKVPPAGNSRHSPCTKGKRSIYVFPAENFPSIKRISTKKETAGTDPGDPFYQELKNIQFRGTTSSA